MPRNSVHTVKFAPFNAGRLIDIEQKQPLINKMWRASALKLLAVTALVAFVIPMIFLTVGWLTAYLF